MDFLGNLGGWVAGIGVGVVGVTTLVSWGAYWAFNKFLFPKIDTAEEKEAALIICKALDEITDDLRANYPKNKWVETADKLVDKIQKRVESAKIKN